MSSPRHRRKCREPRESSTKTQDFQKYKYNKDHERPDHNRRLSSAASHRDEDSAHTSSYSQSLRSRTKRNHQNRDNAHSHSHKNDADPSGKGRHNQQCHTFPQGREHTYRRNKSSSYASEPRIKQNVHGKRHDGKKAGSSQSTGQSSAEKSDEKKSRDSDNLEIPGFYYDKEKKKYFRILPGQNNAHAGVVTKATMQLKVSEDKRQKDLAKFHKPKSSPASLARLNDAYPQRKAPKFSPNICNLVEHVHSGSISNIRCRNSVQKLILSNLRPKGSVKIFKSPSCAYEKLEHSRSLHLNQNNNKLLCLWTVAGLVTQRIQMLKLNAINQTDCDYKHQRPVIDLAPTGTVILQSLSKVTHICWAPVNPSNTEEDNSILYTTTCFLGNSPSLAMFRNLDSTTVEGFRHTEFNLGNKATWTCAWNAGSKQFSVGSEKCGLLLDVATRRMWQLYTENSDVLTQSFSTGGQLYSGTRLGRVLAHDLRSSSTHPCFILKHNVSVCHLHLLEDENYLLAGYFDGKIQKWDVRKRKVVLQYPGLNNEYTRLPFYVHEADSLLYAAGQDCYTHLWNLHTGAPLTSLPPPHQASRDTIPALVYSSNLASRPGHPSLLLGMQDQLHLYSL